LVLSWRHSPAALPKFDRFSLPTLQRLLTPGLAFLALQTAGIVGFGIDNLVIGYALGPVAVTRYAVSFSLLMAASAVASTASTALLPTITGTYTQARRENLVNGFTMAMRLALVYGGVGAIVLWVAGPYLLRFWAGAGVFPGALTFALQLTLFLLQVVIEPPWAILVATTRHYGAALMHGVESGLNLLLSLWWVQVFGLSGVIAGTVVARLVTTAWYIPRSALITLDLPSRRAVRVLGPGIGLLLATLGAVVTLWPNTEHISIGKVVQIAIAGTLLFLLAFAWLGLSREELRSLSARLGVLRIKEQGV
jgi:O-antigen/teichoic acid export membrane protein